MKHSHLVTVCSALVIVVVCLIKDINCKDSRRLANDVDNVDNNTKIVGDKDSDIVGDSKDLTDGSFEWKRASKNLKVAGDHISARGSKGGGKSKPKKQGLMARILPMLIIPFVLQTAIIPIVLSMLKMALLKSAMIGKLAILVGLVNMFRISTNPGGVYTHNINLEKGSGHKSIPPHLAASHYGYNENEEFGAYVNRRRRSTR